MIGFIAVGIATCLTLGFYMVDRPLGLSVMLVLLFLLFVAAAGKALA